MAKKSIEQDIIDAATKIFVEKGMDGARMQEIAQTAGINQALLHYYFRSKEKLFNKVLRNTMGNFFRTIFVSLPPDNDFESFLKGFISLYIDRVVSHEGFIRFVLWEIQRGAPIFSEAMKEILNAENAPIPLVKQKVKSGVDSGKIREIDPIHFMITLISACLYPFIARPILENVFEIDFEGQDFIEERKKEIFDIIWNGVKK